MHVMQALLHEAGVYPGAPGSSADAFPVDPVKWEYFKNWFLKALNVLLHVSRALPGQQLTVHACLYCINFSGEDITSGLLRWHVRTVMNATLTACICPSSSSRPPHRKETLPWLTYPAVRACWQALCWRGC